MKKVAFVLAALSLAAFGCAAAPGNPDDAVADVPDDAVKADVVRPAAPSVRTTPPRGSSRWSS